MLQDSDQEERVASVRAERNKEGQAKSQLANKDEHSS